MTKATIYWALTALVTASACKAVRPTSGSETKDIVAVEGASGHLRSLSVRTLPLDYPKQDPVVEVCALECRGTVTTKLEGLAADPNTTPYRITPVEATTLRDECSKPLVCYRQEAFSKLVVTNITNPLKRAQFLGVLYGQRMFPVTEGKSLALNSRAGVTDPNLVTPEVLQVIYTILASAPMPTTLTPTVLDGPAASASLADGTASDAVPGTPNEAGAVTDPDAEEATPVGGEVAFGLPVPDACLSFQTKTDCLAQPTYIACAWTTPAAIDNTGAGASSAAPRCVGTGIANCPNYNGYAALCASASGSNGTACHMAKPASLGNMPSGNLTDLGLCTEN